MHILHTFFTGFRAEKEKLIVSFSAKNKKPLAEKLKIKRLKKQIQAEIDVKFIALDGLKNSLQTDKAALTLIQIQTFRYEIRKIEFEIIQKREDLGELNERLNLLNLENYAD